MRQEGDTKPGEPLYERVFLAAILAGYKGASGTLLGFNRGVSHVTL
jgi:hypothetical protein